MIGGKSNTIQKNSNNSLVIGGEGNSLLNTNNVAVVASKNTTFPTADGSVKQNVFVGGGDRNAIKGSTLFVFGAGGNEAGSESVLLGKNIKA